LLTAQLADVFGLQIYNFKLKAPEALPTLPVFQDEKKRGARQAQGDGVCCHKRPITYGDSIYKPQQHAKAEKQRCYQGYVPGFFEP
jgi:hypothetical protein